MAQNQPNKTVPEKDSYQVSTTIPGAYWAALEDHRWSDRLKMTEVVRTALDEYAEKRGIDVTGSETTGEATAD